MQETALFQQKRPVHATLHFAFDCREECKQSGHACAHGMLVGIYKSGYLDTEVEHLIGCLRYSTNWPRKDWDRTVYKLGEKARIVFRSIQFMKIHKASQDQLITGNAWSAWSMDVVRLVIGDQTSAEFSLSQLVETKTVTRVPRTYCVVPPRQSWYWELNFDCRKNVLQKAVYLFAVEATFVFTGV